jgi:hypothetical protein
MGLFGKIKLVLGKLTDLLLIGRSAGWWNDRGGPNFKK